VTRQFSLGEHADENAIEANLENGVLNIRIAKRAEAEPKARQIEVK
jgi:HSP20 family molecular chaperone IbpA